MAFKEAQISLKKESLLHVNKVSYDDAYLVIKQETIVCGSIKRHLNVCSLNLCLKAAGLNSMAAFIFLVYNGFPLRQSGFLAVTHGRQ
jgi:hypothetical protein